MSRVVHTQPARRADQKKTAGNASRELLDFSERLPPAPKLESYLVPNGSVGAGVGVAGVAGDMGMGDSAGAAALPPGVRRRN